MGGGSPGSLARSSFRGATVFCAQGLEFSWTTFCPRAGIPHQPSCQLAEQWWGQVLLAWAPQQADLGMCVWREGGSSQELKNSSVNTVGLQKSAMVSLLQLGFLKSFSVPQFPCLQGEAMDPPHPRPNLSALWREEGQLMKRKLQALGWGVHCQPPKLDISMRWVPSRSQVGC